MVGERSVVESMYTVVEAKIEIRGMKCKINARQLRCHIVRAGRSRIRSANLELIDIMQPHLQFLRALL